MENVGLKRGYLELFDYREDYPAIYEKEKEELLKIYQGRIKYIDHVGSTSIKGIKSKPIIDINIQTDDLDDFIKYTESVVEGNVYTVKKEPTLGGDYLIRKEEDGKVKAFIHVYKTGDMNGITSMLFRDYLNSHEEERKRYQELKMELFDKYKDNRKEYTHGKDEYIKKIIALALKEKKMNFIRKAINTDIDEIIKIYNSLVGTPGCTWNMDYPNIDDVKNDFSKDSLYVVCEGDNIIGVAAAGKDDELEHLECWNKDIKNPCDLARIGVKVEYQGRGIAKELIRYIEKDVIKRGFDGIHFLVSKTNPKALAVYDKLEYHKCGETTMYGINWYCYEKKL